MTYYIISRKVKDKSKQYFVNQFQDSSYSHHDINQVQQFCDLTQAQEKLKCLNFTLSYFSGNSLGFPGYPYVIETVEENI